MTLHARSVASAAGATPEIFDTVVERLVESGEIKVWKARGDRPRGHRPGTSPVGTAAAGETSQMAAGHGKIILLGEHAVVYGSRAIAAPVPLAVRARVMDADDGIWLVVPRWGVEQLMQPRALQAAVLRGTRRPDPGTSSGWPTAPCASRCIPSCPRAMGLGGSAAVAVAIIRALDQHFALGLVDEEVNDLAFRCEKVAHGTPSGIDNTVATYGQMLLYRAGSPAEIEELHVEKPINFVIGMTGVESLTAKMVARVREAWTRYRPVYDRMFKGIDALTVQALDALRRYDLERLGDLMNVCQGLLNGLQVSSRELEELIQIAREHGALGAKLTGGGGGGSMIALCPDGGSEVVRAIQDAGYQAMEVQIG